MRSTLRILAVGDIMAGDTPLRFGFGAGTSMLRMGCDAMARRLRKLLDHGDLIIGNLESPLGSIPWPVTDYLNHQFLSHPSVARVLSLGGFNVLNVANNHIMQHGQRRFEETISLLESEDIGIAGRSVSGLCEPHRCSIGGVRIAIFGFSLRPEVYANGLLPYGQADTPERLLSSIEKHRGDWDLCIASLHWGAEYMCYVAPSQRQISELLFKAGVDIILGHHPHVLQPVEIRRGKLVAYSLGNFVFDMWRARPRRSAILDILWSPEGGVQSVKFRPVLIAEDGWPDSAPERLAGFVQNALTLNRDGLSNRATQIEGCYWKRAARAEMINALHNRLFFASNLLRYSPTVRTAALKHFVLCRIKRS